MIAFDKQAHFWAGAAIAASVALYINPAYGLVTGVLAGAAKELYDRTGRGTPDAKDFVATALGAIVVVPDLLL